MGISQVHGFLREKRTSPRATFVPIRSTVRSTPAYVARPCVRTGVILERSDALFSPLSSSLSLPRPVIVILKHNILWDRGKTCEPVRGGGGLAQPSKVMTLLECTCMGIRYLARDAYARGTAGAEGHGVEGRNDARVKSTTIKSHG